MMRSATRPRADSTYVRPTVHYEDQIAPSRTDWVTEHTVRFYNDDDLRDWFSATRRHLGTPTMALVVAEGLKALNYTQLPVTTSGHSRPSYSHGQTDGYASKSRARSNSIEPSATRMGGRNEKHGGATQYGYEQGYHNQQISNVKSTDAQTYGGTHTVKISGLNDAYPYSGARDSTVKFPGAKSNEAYPYGGAQGSTSKPSKGYQSSDYPPAYQSYSNGLNDSKEMPTGVPNVYNHGQPRDSQRHGSGQAPYAQQPYPGPYYDDNSSSTSDSSQYSDRPFKN